MSYDPTSFRTRLLEAAVNAAARVKLSDDKNTHDIFYLADRFSQFLLADYPNDEYERARTAALQNALVSFRDYPSDVSEIIGRAESLFGILTKD